MPGAYVVRSPYAVNLTAELQRIEEESRLREDSESRARRTVERERARLRRQVISQAREEAARMQVVNQHQNRVDQMTHEKRIRALRSVRHAEERHRRERADIHRRFYDTHYDPLNNLRIQAEDPSAEVVRQREEEWQQRRRERRRALEERIRTVQAIDKSKRMEAVVTAQARKVRARGGGGRGRWGRGKGRGGSGAGVRDAGCGSGQWAVGSGQWVRS